MKKIGIFLLFIVFFLGGYFLGCYKNVVGEKTEETNNNASKPTEDESDSLLDGGNTGSLLDLSKLSKYKNYDGSYSSIKSELVDMFGKSYYMNLRIDGNFEMNITSNSDRTSPKLIATKIIDFIYRDFDSSVVLLDSDGYVYKYKLGSYIDGDYQVNKVEDLDGVFKIFMISHCSYENAGCSLDILGDIGNDYVLIK